MSSWKPIEDREDSDLLETTDIKERDAYIEEALYVEGMQIQWMNDMSTMLIILRILLDFNGQPKYLSLQFGRDATIREFKMSVEKIIYRVQDELESMSPETPDETVITTAPSSNYTPDIWAKKMAQRVANDIDQAVLRGITEEVE